MWSLHPSLLDRAALIACWRESLLAQKVLAGQTKGYKHHPQLQRFREGGDSAALIAAYLACLADEADARGYNFNRTKIVAPPATLGSLTVTTGQLKFELAHLCSKVEVRAEDWLPRLNSLASDDDIPPAHPLFRVVEGPVEEWERAAG